MAMVVWHQLSRFRAGMLVTLALSLVLVPNHHAWSPSRNLGFAQ